MGKDEVEALVGDAIRDLMYQMAPARFKFPQGLRYQYYGKFVLFTGIWAFCYSTTRNENGKFVSWVYQPLVGKKSWKAGKILEHRRMKDAKARALKMFKAHWGVQEKYEELYKQRGRKK